MEVHPAAFRVLEDKAFRFLTAKDLVFTPGPLAVPLQFEVGGLLKTSVDRLPPDLALELQGFPHFDGKPLLAALVWCLHTSRPLLWKAAFGRTKELALFTV